MLTDKQISESLSRHRAEADVSPLQYFRQLQTELADSIRQKRRLYLDTKYWILLRDAAMGRARSPLHTNILSALRAAVSGGRAICPVSDAAYVESMQQTDRETRLATAYLMDELSCGVTIATEETRVGLELRNFFTKPDSEFSTLHSSIWVRSGFVLGETVPHHAVFDAATNRVAQKSFIDLMWAQTVADFAAQEHFRSSDAMEASAEKINVKLVKYADQIRSFEQAVNAEFSGCSLLVNSKLAGDLLARGHKNASSADIENFQEALQRCLYNALRLRPDFMAKRTPTLFIHAMCHAAIRWDKGRKLDSHWLFDIHHACAGLAYHDVMFTEHALKILVTSGKMRMDQRFSANVLSTNEEVLQYLNTQLGS